MCVCLIVEEEEVCGQQKTNFLERKQVKSVHLIFIRDVEEEDASDLELYTRYTHSLKDNLREGIHIYTKDTRDDHHAIQSGKSVELLCTIRMWILQDHCILACPFRAKLKINYNEQ